MTQLIKDILIRLSLPLERCRGQCYDGASNMSGRRSGVATQIQLEEPRALYVHCMGHSLNLAVQDTSRSVKVMADTFDTVLELAKLFKYSAKKKAMLLNRAINNGRPSAILRAKRVHDRLTGDLSGHSGLATIPARAQLYTYSIKVHRSNVTHAQ